MSVPSSHAALVLGRDPAVTGDSADAESDDNDIMCSGDRHLSPQEMRYLLIERLSETMNIHDPRKSADVWPEQQAARNGAGYADWRERIDPHLRVALRRNRGWETRRNGLADLLWAIRCTIQHLNCTDLGGLFPGDPLWSQRAQVVPYYTTVFPSLWQDTKRVMREARVLRTYASRSLSEETFRRFCAILYDLVLDRGQSRWLYESQTHDWFPVPVDRLHFGVDSRSCDWVVEVFFSTDSDGYLQQQTRGLHTFSDAIYMFFF